MRKFFAEVIRRNVHKVALGYLAVGWLITEVLTTAVPAIDAPEWIAKLALLLFLLGLPLALWFAWEFEVTPDGIKRTHEVEPGASIAAETGQRLNKIIIGVLVAVVALLLIDRFLLDWPTRANPPGEQVQSAENISSIAVLPFADFSESGDQAYIGNGIADTVLHLLAQAPDLKVAARTSSFSFQGKGVDIATIAAELGVGAVLEGSVQRSGDQLRVIAQLIRASDQTHLWSQTFNNTTDNVFAIQDEIASSVLQALRPDMATTHPPMSERTDVRAYEHYLKGKELRISWNAEAAEAAVRELQAATLIDPDFVPALVELGIAYQALNEITPRTWAEVAPLAEASLRRAVEIAPDDPYALAGLAIFVMNSGDNPLSARPLLEKALAANPNDTEALSAYAELLDLDGEFERSLDLYRRAYTLDPNNPERAVAYGRQLSRMGHHEEARTVAQRLLLIRPDESHGHRLLAAIAQTEGRYDLAIKHTLDERELNPRAYYIYHDLAHLYARLDDQDAALAWYERTPDQTDDYIPAAVFWTPAEIDRELQHRKRDLELYPRWNYGQRNYIRALFLSGDVEAGVQAVAEYEDAFESDRFGTATAVAGVLAGRLGRDELSQRLMQRSRQMTAKMLSAGYALPFAQHNLAVLAIGDGDHEAAFEALSAHANSGAASLRYLKLHPVWDPLRDDPRFDSLLASLQQRLRDQRERLRADGL